MSASEFIRRRPPLRARLQRHVLRLRRLAEGIRPRQSEIGRDPERGVNR